MLDAATCGGMVDGDRVGYIGLAGQRVRFPAVRRARQPAPWCCPGQGRYHLRVPPDRHRVPRGHGLCSCCDRRSHAVPDAVGRRDLPPDNTSWTCTTSSPPRIRRSARTPAATQTPGPRTNVPGSTTYVAISNPDFQTSGSAAVGAFRGRRADHPHNADERAFLGRPHALTLVDRSGLAAPYAGGGPSASRRSSASGRLRERAGWTLRVGMVGSWALRFSPG